MNDTINFSQVRDWSERYEMAENPNTRREVLDVLSKDSVSFVRWAVANNPNVSKEQLETLLCDEESDVRLAVASKTPYKKHLRILIDDKNESVRSEAEKRFTEISREYSREI